MKYSNKIEKLNKDCRGMSLIELMVTVAIMSVVAVMMAAGFNIINKSKIQMQARMSSDQESTIWLGFMRKNLNISLLDETAPATSPKLTKYDVNDGGSRGVKYVFYLEDKSEIRHEILSILNRCVPSPPKVSSLIPQLKDTYLGSALTKLGADPGCVSHLTSLNCEAGKSVVSELSIATQNGKKHFYPAILGTTAPRMFTFENQIAGMVCVLQTPQNYLLVQMVAATLRQDKFGNDPMRWTLRKIVIPPLNNGNNQYLNQ
jgi:prepilin-type N-terminal cleavage/methylation domain-containing protein